MKNFIIFISLLLLSALYVSCNRSGQDKDMAGAAIVAPGDSTDRTNNFYDNAETYSLKMGEMEVQGEITNPGNLNFAGLQRHSVIVKETLLDGDKDRFVGAYRYDGYSLYDILNDKVLNKKNKEEFNPIIDLYVEIENENGEKVILSWGEIFYPNHLHEILIADRVMRIVPSKTKELWDLPVDYKLVVGSDLITERNISKPVKITVKSYPKSFTTIKGLDPVYSPQLSLFVENERKESLSQNPSDLDSHSLHTIFYGRGRGIHSTQPFTGVLLRDVIAKHLSPTQKDYREGIILVVATDGYRSVYSFAEVFDRNDQAEVLLIADPEDKRDGIFRLFPSCDFFSDRAVKGIKEIYYSVNQK